MDVAQWILTIVAVPLLGFIGKIAYDYGKITANTKNILDKLNEYIDRSDNRVDGLEKKVEELEEKLNDAVKSIVALLERCKINHKE